ncbi:hypothetical protein chiPu_0024846, partial [Chiloscyllium punctatum]|nr:hypothetical protein [Chiloscyllium punctatum]
NLTVCFLLQNYLIKSRVVLENLQPEMWTEEYEHNLDDFIYDTRLRVLTVHMDQFIGLQVHLGTPSHPTDHLIFFIRKENTEIDAENFVHVVQFGTIRGGYLESLLRHMLGIYAPQFLENRMWPDSLKNNFSAHLHKFLASLTGTNLPDIQNIGLPAWLLSVSLGVACCIPVTAVEPRGMG